MTAVPATLRLRREGVLRSRAARGDAVAFAAVYQRHHQALYRYCRSILRHEEDAQDALQSTMARAFAALQDERRDFELRPWLFRIAHNEAISILRRRRATAELNDVPGEESETEDRVSEREELRMLRLDLADLPERQRAALVLRELNGLSHVEIGTVLEVSPAAVKQAIFEARSALFSCREGREMVCHDVRRMLSDGDGRVLRGRGVRAHLRTCPDCRRFRADLAQRPQALRMLAPPLPAAGAATLFAQLLGGPAVKLLACVAVAGGGTTLAVEMHDVPKPAAPPAAERAQRTPRPATPRTVARDVPAATSVPRATAPVRVAAVRETPRDRKAAKRAHGRRPSTPAAAAPVAATPRREAATARPVPTARAERKARVDKPTHERRVKPEKPKKARPVDVAAPDERAAPKRVKQERKTPRGRARPEADVVAEAPAVQDEVAEAPAVEDRVPEAPAVDTPAARRDERAAARNNDG